MYERYVTTVCWKYRGYVNKHVELELCLGAKNVINPPAATVNLDPSKGFLISCDCLQSSLFSALEQYY